MAAVGAIGAAPETVLLRAPPFFWTEMAKEQTKPKGREIKATVMVFWKQANGAPGRWDRIEVYFRMIETFLGFRWCDVEYLACRAIPGEVKSNSLFHYAAMEDWDFTNEPKRPIHKRKT